MSTKPKSRKSPPPNGTVSYTFRIPTKLLKQYREGAAAEERSLSSHIIRTLREVAEAKKAIVA